MMKDDHHNPVQEKQVSLLHLPIIRLDAGRDPCAAADLECHVEDGIFGRTAILDSIQSAGTTASTRYNTIAHLVGFIVDHAAGSYLYANHVLDLVARGHLVVRSGCLSGLPRSLAEVYHLRCGLAFPTPESFSPVSRVLSICLAAAQPMRLKDIVGILGGSSDNGATWSDAVVMRNIVEDVRKFGMMLRVKEDRVEFEHSSVRDWLQDSSHR